MCPTRKRRVRRGGGRKRSRLGELRAAVRDSVYVCPEWGFPRQMDVLQRVAFRFGEDTEVHYLDRLPTPGGRVTHGRELWIVTRVGADSVGALVVCERPGGRLGRELVERAA